MKKATTLLIIVTIISKIFGFVRELTLSYFYGASNISDAYLISLTIPTVIFSFIGTGLYTGYIPMYSRIKHEDGEERAIRFTNNLSNTTLILCAIIVIFSLIFTKILVKMFAMGFEGETLDLAIKFTRISILGIFFTALMYIYNGFLRLHGSYITSAITGFPLNIIIIAAILISAYTNIMVLAIGSLFAIMSQLFILIPFTRSRNLRFRFTLDLKDKYIKRMAIIALPIIIGASIDQVNILIDRTMASNIAIGGVSALNYGSKLNGFIHGIFVTSISTVMYPTITKMIVKEDMGGLRKTINESINMISLLVAPAALGAIVFAEPIVKVLFARGAFGREAISMTASVLLFYSVGSLGYGYRDIFARAFYSMEDTKTPMVNGIIAVILNLILNVILSKYLGLGGLALASSMSAITATLLLGFNLRKKIEFIGVRNMLVTLLKILFSSVLMAIMAKIVFDKMIEYLSLNVSLFISIGLGAVLYVGIIYFMKIDEVDGIIRALKARLGKV